MPKCFFLIFLTWTVFQSSAQLSNYNVGDTVNDFSITDIDGNTYTLYDLLNQGKYVYIDFFATNCGSCQTKIPVFNGFYDKYGCNEGDVFCISIEVSNHDDATVVAFEQQYGGTSNHAPVVTFNGNANAVVSDFGLNSYPTICAIDPTKKLFAENISPVSSVHDIAQSFPLNFNPPVMSCSNNIEMNNQHTFHIFPIPTHRHIHINGVKTTALEIDIYDLNGLKVYHNIFSNQNNINIDLKLKNGLYIIKLASENIIQYQKIIILK